MLDYSSIISIIKNIDFSNKSDLVFILASAFLAIISFFIIIAIFFEIVKAIRIVINKIFIGVFGPRVFLKENNSKQIGKKDKLLGKSKKIEESIIEPKINIVGGEVREKDSFKKKDIFKLKETREDVEKEEKEIKMPVSGEKEDNIGKKGQKPVWGPNGQEFIDEVSDEIKVPRSKRNNFGNIGAKVNTDMVVSKISKDSIKEANNDLSTEDLKINIKSNSKKLDVVKKQDNTIFHGRDHIHMTEAVYDIEEAPSSMGGYYYSEKDRKEIAEKISSYKKFGAELEKSERNRIYKSMSDDWQRASPLEKQKIEKQVKFLQKTIGK